jgi:hypothetical protein
LLKVAIEREWKKRLELARKGNYKAGTPSEGMLAKFGYHVGAVNGVEIDARRKILRHFVESQLPMVGSPAYSDEWGEPGPPPEKWSDLNYVF